MGRVVIDEIRAFSTENVWIFVIFTLLGNDAVMIIKIRSMPKVELYDLLLENINLRY